MSAVVAYRLHPLVAVAAIAVIVFSAVGVGVMTGWISLSQPEAQAFTETPVSPASVLPSPPLPSAAVQSVSTPRIKLALSPAADAAKPGAQRVTEAAKSQQAVHTEPKVAEAPASPSVAQAPVACADCGVIDAITPVEQEGSASGVGAIAGGVAGALLGNQVGKGTGRTIATVIGAAGGAYAGHKIEQNVRKDTVWNITLRMDDGTYRTLSETTQPSWYVGQKVKLINGAIVAN
ncbi:MAG: glycine zipper 2TM domain-containing protein [Burkholderiales bacterium]